MGENLLLCIVLGEQLELVKVTFKEIGHCIVRMTIQRGNPEWKIAFHVENIEKEITFLLKIVSSICDGNW